MTVIRALNTANFVGVVLVAIGVVLYILGDAPSEAHTIILAGIAMSVGTGAVRAAQAHTETQQISSEVHELTNGKLTAAVDTAVDTAIAKHAKP